MSKRDNTAATKTPTVAYLRVSTTKQADHGVSLDAQRAKVEAYASLYDLDLVEVLVDAGASAKTLDRPALRNALAMLDDGTADALLVVKLDRLTRSVRDLGALVERYFAPGKSTLLSVGEQIDTRSAAGRLVLNVLMSVAQWEREAIGERTAVALAHKRDNMEKTGGSEPYGWRLDIDGVHLVPHDGEQAILRAAHDLREAGLSLRKIGAELAADGLLPRSGRSWHPQSIKQLLAGRLAA